MPVGMRMASVDSMSKETARIVRPDSDGPVRQVGGVESDLADVPVEADGGRGGIGDARGELPVKC